MANIHTLIRAARGLHSEQGENPEYDRALVELIIDTVGGAFGDMDSEDRRAYVSKLIDPRVTVFDGTQLFEKGTLLFPRQDA